MYTLCILFFLLLQAENAAAAADSEVSENVLYSIGEGLDSSSIRIKSTFRI